MITEIWELVQSRIWTIFFVGLPVYWILWIAYARLFHPYADIPGPFFASVSRLYLMYKMARGDIHKAQREWHEKYGVIVRVAPNEVAISDPEAIKVIYAVNAGFRKTDFYSPFASHISKNEDHFTQQNEKVHAERRRIVNHLYSMSNILQSEKYIDECTELWMDRMGQFADSGETFDLGEWLQMYAFDVVGELFFGKMFGFLRDKCDYGTYIKTLDTLLPTIAVALVMPSYGRVALFVAPVIPAVRKALKCWDGMIQVAKRAVNERQENMKTGKVERSDMLDRFFQIHNENPSFGIPDITTESFIAILAGSDTTSITLRATMYYLMKNPSSYKKLVDEINKADAEGSLSRPIRYAEAIKLPYLDATIKEALRIHPGVGFHMPRHVPPGGKQIAGRYFAENSRVAMSGTTVHFDKTIFGADADEWNPDRWLSDNAKKMDRYMIAFGAGPRTCIGKNISLSEIYKLVPNTLRDFDVTWASPNKDWSLHNYWFYKQSGIEVKITRRKQA